MTIKTKAFIAWLLEMLAVGVICASVPPHPLWRWVLNVAALVVLVCASWERGRLDMRKIHEDER